MHSLVNEDHSGRTASSERSELPRSKRALSSTLNPCCDSAYPSELPNLRESFNANETSISCSGEQQVLVWGSDAHGQMGIGNSKNLGYCIPRLCQFDISIAKISCGAAFSAFITKDGLIFTMGSNEKGQLGIGQRNTESSSVPVLVESLEGERARLVACSKASTAVVLESGALYSWGSGKYGALGIGSQAD